jgi:hypothetical protein
MASFKLWAGITLAREPPDTHWMGRRVDLDATEKGILLPGITIIKWIITVLVSVHRPVLKTRSRHFGNWVCFRPQVKGEDAYSVGPLRKS